jgi:hypothetical protein
MRWFALARGEGMKLLLVLAGVVLAGCTTAHVTRYTWASADPNLKQADIECLKETNNLRSRSNLRPLALRAS